jgi:hypothetical protein
LKETWKILKDLTKTTKLKSNYPTKFQHNGSTINDSTLIAQNFNDFFTNIGPNLASKIPDSNVNPIHYTGNYSHSLFFSPTDVHEINSLLNMISIITKVIIENCGR